MKKGYDLTLATAMPFGRGRGYGYGYASSLASTYTGSTAGSTAGSRDGNLPDIALRLPQRHRPPSGLQLMGAAVPNLGPHPHVPMTPRERERPEHSPLRLSSSDSKALESLRPIRGHCRRNTSDDRPLLRRDKPPNTLLGGASRPSSVMPLPQRPPSSLPYGTLPPITSDVPSSSEADASNEECSGSGKESETESSLGESEEEVGIAFQLHAVFIFKAIDLRVFRNVPSQSTQIEINFNQSEYFCKLASVCFNLHRLFLMKILKSMLLPVGQDSSLMLSKVATHLIFLFQQ